jgi:hypothetical protein
MVSDSPRWDSWPDAARPVGTRDSCRLPDHWRLRGDRGGLSVDPERPRLHASSGRPQRPPPGPVTDASPGAARVPPTRAAVRRELPRHQGTRRPHVAPAAVHDGKTLTMQENRRARAVIDGTKTARTPRFVTTRNGTRSLVPRTRSRVRCGWPSRRYRAVAKQPDHATPALQVYTESSLASATLAACLSHRSRSSASVGGMAVSRLSMRTITSWPLTIP